MSCYINFFHFICLERMSDLKKFICDGKMFSFASAKKLTKVITLFTKKYQSVYLIFNAFVIERMYKLYPLLYQNIMIELT